jgi:hypothetical protein
LKQKEKEEKKKNVDVVGEVEKFGDFSITSQKDKSEKTSAEGEAKGGEGQGPQTQDQGQGYLLLIREGVREEVARVLAESHTKERIEEVVRMASDKKLSNKPGFMVRSLEEGWIDAPATGKRTKNKTRRWVSIERNIFKFDPLAKKEDSKEDENDIWAFAARKEREAYEREIQEERERLSHTGKRG